MTHQELAEVAREFQAPTVVAAQAGLQVIVAVYDPESHDAVTLGTCGQDAVIANLRAVAMSLETGAPVEEV